MAATGIACKKVKVFVLLQKSFTYNPQIPRASG